MTRNKNETVIGFTITTTAAGNIEIIDNFHINKMILYPDEAKALYEALGKALNSESIPNTPPDQL